MRSRSVVSKFVRVDAGNMATVLLQQKKITFTICFENSRLTLTIPKSIKVFEVLEKAADEFKVKPECLGFIHNGLQIPEHITIGVCERGRVNDCKN